MIDGERYVLKQWSYEADWLSQALRDPHGAACRAWSAGLVNRVPACIDHATVAMAYDAGTTTALMHDVGALLVPEGDAPISAEQERRFFDHMAAGHAEFWGWTDDVGLIALADRYAVMSSSRIEIAGRASPEALVPPLILQGWRELADLGPAMADALFALHADPTPLVDAMGSTPSTFVHGDWKLGNLGSHPDGRTILVDWSIPGAAPACTDLAHYLALNCARLAGTKESAAATYRGALESHGVATADWWDRQYPLSLLGIMCALGWEKALGGDGAEFRWWEARVADAAALL
ncbi:MAG TPA: phosphotransferase [Acidimicrobiales bacterium]|nr:phosphotransferase [Acidimicrobiales bacterium]